MLQEKFAMMGEGAPVRMVVGELALRTSPKLIRVPVQVSGEARCTLAQATRLPVSLGTSYLRCLSSISPRSRRACVCGAQRARQDARLAAIRTCMHPPHTSCS